MCHNVFNVAQDNSSSSVAQRHQKFGPPARVSVAGPWKSTAGGAAHCHYPVHILLVGGKIKIESKVSTECASLLHHCRKH